MNTSPDIQHQTHPVTISVNDQDVQIEGPHSAGLQIKQAAIAQGVPIAFDFVLSEEIGPRRTKVIGDTDIVTLHKGARFIAVPNDDNS
jgi:hypothetical protein